MNMSFIKKSGVALATLLAVAGLALPASVAAAQGPSGAVHGHVQNAAGMAINKGEVRLTQDVTSEEKNRKYPFVFPLDGSGDFKGDKIPVGSYLAVVFVDGKSIDFINGNEVKPGGDTAINFDMTRKEYMDKMTPEDRKNIEEFKKRNAEAVASNSKVANLNNLLTQARASIKAKNYDDAVAAMTTATAAKPDESILWVVLGDAQLGAASAAATGGHANDPAVQQKYKDAAASYQKGIDLNAASKKPSVETAGAAYNQLGQSLAKSGDLKGASAAYDNAAKAQPSQAGMYFFNEAATLLNANQNDDAAVAADKAIAADPKRADAYFIKGQSLISKASVDPKTSKITVPPGCVDAYQQYLALDPNGAHAPEVKQILEGIGEKITSTYKAAPNKKK